MGHTRARTAAVGLLVCLPALLLAALPALGWRPGHVPHTGFVQADRVHDTVFMSRVRISGEVELPLSPGVTSPVAITFRNLNTMTIEMRRLRLKIARISAPHADSAHPCTRLDFRIRQLRQRRLLIPAGGSIDLAGLGIPMLHRPALSMVNRPVNQDGCKDASITLRFRARRVEGR